MAGCAHLFGPDAALDLADVRLPKQVHAQARLADAAADGAGECTREQFLVEIEFLLVFFTPEGQLAQQGGFVDADAHAGHLECLFENRVPQEDVTVQARQPVFARRAPVVVVGGAAVGGTAVGKRSADADDEHGLVLLWETVPGTGRAAAGRG